MFLLGLYNLYFSTDRKYARILKNLLGFVPHNISLYRSAFRHRSAVQNLKGGPKSSNERLEFLGDAVLGCIVADELFKLYPYKDEGFLTEMRSKIVSRTSLNQLARRLGIAEIIELDQQMRHHTGQRSSVLGNAFEALIGAIYIDKGYRFTHRLIANRILKPHVDIPALELTETNFKSKLLEWCQRQGKTMRFELIPNDEGETDRLFSMQAIINEIPYAIGRDYNKKNAEKIAAEKTCEQLGILK